jgi:hypothetical protein
LIVLIALTAWVLRPGGDKPAGAGATTPQTTLHLSTTPTTPTTPATTPATTPTTSASTTSTHGATTGTQAASARCVVSKLTISAVSDKTSYNVGDQPVLMLQVKNPGHAPCIQDLADQQIELRVYNGESRVWGSHDCQVVPGTADRTLMAGQTVRVSIVWSGLSSQPKCAGTRQRVGAGTYTLYALLAGREGTATQFAIS